MKRFRPKFRYPKVYLDEINEYDLKGVFETAMKSKDKIIQCSTPERETPKCDYCGYYNENRIQCWYCSAPLDIGRAYPKKLPYDPFKVPTTDEIETAPINKQHVKYDPTDGPRLDEIETQSIHR